MNKGKRAIDQTFPQSERRKLFYEKVDNQSMSLRETVVEFRLMLGKSQEEFARFAKIPLSTLRGIEQGRANPTLKTLEKALKGSGLVLSVKRK